MSDETRNLIEALDRNRTEQRQATAELRQEMRDGFQLMGDQLRGDHGRLERHSERLRALDRRTKGDGSDNYRAHRAATEASLAVPPAPPAPPKAWWLPLALTAGGALAGSFTTKAAPKVFALLAEILK